MPRKRRRVCFVTGTRAEFGLMQRTLRAIEAERSLELQIIATGMHLDRSRGNSIDQIRAAAFTVDATVPWRGSLATATGRATADLAEALQRLNSDIVLVVGDRVEAFAGATAGHLSGRVVAHVHGGDRALGQVDDALRHSISKLAHVHFAATADSARRLIRLGEDRWRVHLVGAPGIDGIIDDADPRAFAGLPRRGFILIILHPTDGERSAEVSRAKLALATVQKVIDLPIVIVYPNNDPGSAGIAECWSEMASRRVRLFQNLPRETFLAALRDCAALVGNSSAGIIEAASFGTAVVDIGDRQKGRLHSQNLFKARFNKRSIALALKKSLRFQDSASHSRLKNVYGGDGTGRAIATTLRSIELNDRLKRKFISY